MIIGNGDIASVLKEVDRDDLTFFASGVSNSQEDRKSEYMREVDLLDEQNPSRHLVYFSSLSIFHTNTKYTMHKRAMEESIKKWFSTYTIVRLGNITWGDNPHTFINYFKRKIQNNEPISIKDEYRYLIDKEEFLHWMKLIPIWSCEMNLPGKRMKVQEIVNKLQLDEGWKKYEHA